MSGLSAEAANGDGALFELGRIAVTEGAHHALDDAGQTAEEFVERHARGDWGDISAETQQKNRDALGDGHRIESVYHTTKGEKLLVVTEPDRSFTTVLRPDEF